MPQPLDSRFPEAIQELWASLTADVVWLHGRWIVYRQLFGTSEERVNLLNETAGTVTWVLQNLLLNDVQLTLSKIGDPVGSEDKKNLTLRRLQLALKEIEEIELYNQLEPLLETFEASCKKLRNRRNKWIAHNDLSAKIDALTEPPKGPSREEIEISLNALRAILNCIEFKFTVPQTVYEQFIMHNDGQHLIYALAESKRYRELVKEGVIPRDDFRRRFPDGV